MATLTITFTTSQQAGERLLTIDNADPSIQITAGPYQNSSKLYF